MDFQDLQASSAGHDSRPARQQAGEDRFQPARRALSSAPEFSWLETRIGSRSADALRAGLPDGQIELWSTRYRIPPCAATVDSLPRLTKLGGNEADRELASIIQSGDLVLRKPKFPEQRQCQDAKWIVILILAVLLVVSYASVMARQMLKQGSMPHPQVFVGVAVATAVGILAGLILTMSYVFLMPYYPTCMVWVLLLGSPIGLIIAGGLLAAYYRAVDGTVCLGIGIVSLMAVFFGCQEYILFSAKICGHAAKTVARVRGIWFAHCLNTSLILAWSLLGGVAIGSAHLGFQDDKIGLVHAGIAMVYLWVAEVIGNVFQVTHCSLLARRYFGEARRPWRKSLYTAVTVVGSACVSAAVVLPACALPMLRQASARRKGKEGGEHGKLPSIVPCPGPTIEYCGSWALVASSLRDVGHIDAARLAKCFLTCANAEILQEELLMNTISFFGSLLAALVGCAGGALAGYFMDSGEGPIYSGGTLGLLFGLAAGRAGTRLITHSVDALVLFWAEDPAPLYHNDLELHQELELRVVAQLSNEFRSAA